MGIVYSSKLTFVSESGLYTRENYFTGLFYLLPHHNLLATTHHVNDRFRNLLGRVDCRDVQSPMRRVRRYHRFDCSSRGRSGSQPVR